jgi:uncharacterized protein (DUF433 family)
MTTTGYAHIELRDGIPFITGTATKVHVLIDTHLAYGWDGAELQRQLPHLTLGQVYDALAYYYDHKDEIDRILEEKERMAEELLPTLVNPELHAKLKARADAFRSSRE